MIRRAGHPRAARQQVVAAEDMVVDYCGDACVFRTLGPRASFVSHGVRNGGVAALSDGLLYLNTSADVHEAGHPLHLPEDAQSAPARSAAIRAVRDARPDGVVRVVASCDCGHVVGVVTGRPWIDDGHAPAWHRTVFGDAVSLPRQLVDWKAACIGLSQLASGLARLHDLGVAHGDPFLFNAMAEEGGQSVWVDLNDALPLTPPRAFRDYWAFVHHGLLYALKLAPGLAAELDACLFGQRPVEPTEGLRSLASTLATLADKSPALCGAEERDRAFEAVRVAAMRTCRAMSHELTDRLTAQSMTYFAMAAMWNGERARATDARLAMEQTRHAILEREIQRTLARRFEGEKAQLEESGNWFRQQAEAWEKSAHGAKAELDAARSHAEELRAGTMWLQEQVHKLGQVVDEREAELRATRAHVDTIEEGHRSLDQRLASASADQRKAEEASSQARQEIESLRQAIAGRDAELEVQRRRAEQIESEWLAMLGLSRTARGEGDGEGARETLSGDRTEAVSREVLRLQEEAGTLRDFRQSRLGRLLSKLGRLRPRP